MIQSSRSRRRSPRRRRKLSPQGTRSPWDTRDRDRRVVRYLLAGQCVLNGRRPACRALPRMSCSPSRPRWPPAPQPAWPRAAFRGEQMSLLDPSWTRPPCPLPPTPMPSPPMPPVSCSVWGLASPSALPKPRPDDSLSCRSSRVTIAGLRHTEEEVRLALGVLECDLGRPNWRVREILGQFHARDDRP